MKTPQQQTTDHLKDKITTEDNGKNVSLLNLVPSSQHRLVDSKHDAIEANVTTRHLP